jgi:hypothetical protein
VSEPVASLHLWLRSLLREGQLWARREPLGLWRMPLVRCGPWWYLSLWHGTVPTVIRNSLQNPGKDMWNKRTHRTQQHFMEDRVTSKHLELNLNKKSKPFWSREVIHSKHWHATFYTGKEHLRDYWNSSGGSHMWTMEVLRSGIIWNMPSRASGQNLQMDWLDAQCLCVCISCMTR